MLLACSTASFPQERLDMAAARVAWAGFEGVEIVLEGDELPSEDSLRNRLRAEDLQLAAVFAGSMPREPADGDVEPLARVGRAAALARALDCATLVLRAPEGEDLPALARALRLLDRALGSTAVDLCLVNRRGTPLERIDALSALWREGLPERVGLALDPAHALMAGWDPVDLDALPELPRHVYLNDAAGDRVVPPGEGDLDLPGLGEALRLRGYGGSISLLLENANPWEVEPVARELRTAAAGWFGG